MSDDIVKVGRDLGRGPLVRSCILRWKDGNILFEMEDERYAPTQAERAAILARFAQPFTTLRASNVKGALVDAKYVIQPGTLEHFSCVGYHLPKPFARYPGAF